MTGAGPITGAIPLPGPITRAVPLPRLMPGAGSITGGIALPGSITRAIAFTRSRSRAMTVTRSVTMAAAIPLTSAGPHHSGALPRAQPGAVARPIARVAPLGGPGQRHGQATQRHGYRGCFQKPPHIASW